MAQRRVTTWKDDGLTTAAKICPYLEPSYVRREATHALPITCRVGELSICTVELKAILLKRIAKFVLSTALNT